MKIKEMRLEYQRLDSCGLSLVLVRGWSDVTNMTKLRSNERIIALLASFTNWHGCCARRVASRQRWRSGWLYMSHMP